MFLILLVAIIFGSARSAQAMEQGSAVEICLQKNPDAQAYYSGLAAGKYDSVEKLSAALKSSKGIIFSISDGVGDKAFFPPMLQQDIQFLRQIAQQTNQVFFSNSVCLFANRANFYLPLCVVGKSVEIKSINEQDVVLYIRSSSALSQPTLVTRVGKVYTTINDNVFSASLADKEMRQILQDLGAQSTVFEPKRHLPENGFLSFDMNSAVEKKLSELELKIDALARSFATFSQSSVPALAKKRSWLSWRSIGLGWFCGFATGVGASYLYYARYLKAR